MKYQRTNAQLKHYDSWVRAAEGREDLQIEEIYFERDTGGLVRYARGLIQSEGVIRVGNRQAKTPCIINASWSYMGKCTDWRGHRAAQFDLDLQETAAQRRESIENWGFHKPKDLMRDDTRE